MLVDSSCVGLNASLTVILQQEVDHVAVVQSWRHMERSDPELVWDQHVRSSVQEEPHHVHTPGSGDLSKHVMNNVPLMGFTRFNFKETVLYLQMLNSQSDSLTSCRTVCPKRSVLLGSAPSEISWSRSFRSTCTIEPFIIFFLCFLLSRSHRW